MGKLIKKGFVRANHKSDLWLSYGKLELYDSCVIYRQGAIAIPNLPDGTVFKIEKKNIIEVGVPPLKEVLVLGTYFYTRWIYVMYKDNQDNIKRVYITFCSWFKWKKDQKDWLDAFKSIGVVVK